MAPIFSLLWFLVSNDELDMDGSNLVSYTYASDRDNDALHAVASARRGRDRKQAAAEYAAMYRYKAERHEEWWRDSNGMRSIRAAPMK